jgi:hypothetical protein
MRIRVGVWRYKMKSGKMNTLFVIEKWEFPFGWEFLSHHGLVAFRKRADAEEYVRLYNSIK